MPKGENSFKSAHKLGAKKILDRELDAKSTSIKLYKGHKDALRSIPAWQGKVRNFVEPLLNE